MNRKIRFSLFAIIVSILFIAGCLVEEKEKVDTDNDGVIDEIDPDKDNDCIPDEWETTYGMDPLDSSDKYEDPDGDGVDNKNEYDSSTDPLNPDNYSVQMKENITKYGVPLCINASFLYGTLNESDFDDDGIPDDIETLLLMDPGNPDDAWMDYDNDGFMNKVELCDGLYTDPF